MLPNFDHSELPRALQHLLTRDRADDAARLPRRSFLKLRECVQDPSPHVGL